MPQARVKTALISVYDKTGIVDFARALVQEFGIKIISTGGTAALLRQEGIPVTLVEEITGFPEMLDGRVKTLHPRIHAGILADRDNPEHMGQLAAQGIEPIDMVVVNLYPFERTVADPNCTFEQAVEMIDIGGPCLLRAAAKNHRHVLSVDDPKGYDPILCFLRRERSDDLYFAEALQNFTDTARYDASIVRWFSSADLDRDPNSMPRFFREFGNWGEVRYGENPHQRAELWEDLDNSAECDLTIADVPSDEPEQTRMSLNNYVDADAALGLCNELVRAIAGRAKFHFAQASSTPCTSDTPTPRRFPPIRNEVLTRRNLPHWQIPGATYFVTFRSHIGVLTPEERDVVMSAIRHSSGVRLDLHAAAVMPDHVHLLLTPRDVKEGDDRQHNLSAILQSIKTYSSREISRRRRSEVSQVWVHESFDRWVRSETDFIEKYEYIAKNLVKEGLAESAAAYRWWYGIEAMPGDPCFEEIARTKGEHKDSLCAGNAGKSKEDLCSPRSCVFIKHTNPCGVGMHADPIEAYRRAYLGDPNAAMGGILACGFDVDAAFAEAVMETYARWGQSAGAGGFFVEVWVAPSFHEKAVEVIRHRKEWGKRVRLLSVGPMDAAPDPNQLEYKTIAGGMLAQTIDAVGLNEEQWKVVTRRRPNESEISDLRWAWLIAKHTKSNAISICKDGMLIGNGAGQMSRVMSCRIATWLARENGHADKLPGSAAASDAFFPFSDGPTILMDAGVTALIQPGGSKRDEEAIRACDERGAAMIFTGIRHFRH
jgi:AICAR transformylase/IMP cyclohydrolase PurH/REP element-mobilizing transposase RayT